MSSNPLYPAYQKYYSALKCLEQFKVEDNFFDNISSLDTFFSEYRSITLVLQKAIAHTQYKEIYKSFPVELWDSFFNEQRIQTVHIHPTEILKIISLDVYLPDQGINVDNYIISIEEDVTLATLLDSAKDVLEQFNIPEVFFSARFLVVEKRSGIDLWNKILDGLSTMHQFMDFMYSQVDHQCPLCEKIRSSIHSLDPRFAPRDFASVFDYVYYPGRKSFERGSRIGVVFGMENEPNMRAPLSGFAAGSFQGMNFSFFEKFILIHALIPMNNFMPVIMTVYDDSSYSFDVFQSELKTTFYRKINEVALEIRGGSVKEVFLLVVYVAISDASEELAKMTTLERAAFANQEYIVFVRIGDDFREIEYGFTPAQLSDPQYVLSTLCDPKRPSLNLSKSNMTPIIDAFRTRTR